jgi:hypothetical protein
VAEAGGIAVGAEIGEDAGSRGGQKEVSGFFGGERAFWRVEMEPSNYRERSPPAGALTWPNSRLIADLDDASALAQAIVDTIRDPILV